MLTISKLETSLRNILESNAPINRYRPARMAVSHNSLPALQTLYQDFIQRLIQQEDLITSRMELLHENTACKILGRFTHISKVENLVLPLFFIADVLKNLRVSPASFTFHMGSRTLSREVPLPWLVV